MNAHGQQVSPSTRTGAAGTRPGAPTEHRRGRELLTGDEWIMIASHLRLSPRELEITQCVFDDLTDMAIAEELGICVNTVHSHFERLYQKLALRTRTALVVRVFQEYLLQRLTPPPGALHSWSDGARPLELPHLK